MPKMTFILQDGSEKTVSANNGTSLIEIANDNDIPLASPCNGAMSCGMCHVFVDEQWLDLLPNLTEDEEDVLNASTDGVQSNSRLSCQIILTDDLDGLVVKIPS